MAPKQSLNHLIFKSNRLKELSKPENCFNFVALKEVGYGGKTACTELQL